MSLSTPRSEAVGPLPAMLQHTPAAVLLIDLSRRHVTYANRAAADLVGREMRLPVDVDTWGEAAGLTDLSGRPLSDTSSPLSRVATGVAVTGEPVTVHDAARDGGVSDAHRDATEGRLLWVTGFPFAGAGVGAADLALVVFLRLDAGADAEERRLERLRDRAVIATDLSFTISDPGREGNPLVWVNPSFTRLTGYGLDEVVGRNCRFLQGPNTDGAAVDRIRAALRAHAPVTEVLLNHRKDGTAFWNQVSISLVLDGEGRLSNFVAVQSDVTERVLVEHDRERALAAAEEARRHLRLLTDATGALTATLDVVGVAERLAHLTVPAFADYSCVDLLDEPGAGLARRVAAHHRDQALVPVLMSMGDRLAPWVGGDDQVSRVLAGGAPVLLSDLPDTPAILGDDPVVIDGYRSLRTRSAMIVPLHARGQVLGALTLGTERPYGRRYTRQDLEVGSDLGARAALAVDNARLYATAASAAETLQRSLLPVLPVVPGLTTAARYLVATRAQVGGDWYDVLPLPDGATGLAVGDVVGHDLRAAAAMGQLRGLLRSYAWEGLGPAQVLDRCDQLVQGLDVASMATVFYLRLDPAADGGGVAPADDVSAGAGASRGDGGRRRITYSNAGHPYPILREPDGRTRFLDAQRSPLVGAVRDLHRQDATDACRAGSLLVFYTDGVVERRGEDADARQEQLRALVAGWPADIDVSVACDAIVEAFTGEDRQDDVALLIARVEG